MSCGRAWSARCNKSEIKLNVREIEWKSLMNECLMETEILNKCDDECKKYSNLNPNSAMDFRHKMARESTKNYSVPQIQTQTEALKLIRLSNYNRMLKQKEGKMVEKEILRLKETLENNRSLLQEKPANETSKRRAKSSPGIPKYIQYYARQCKRLELLDGVCEIDTWLSRSVQMKMETKINHQGVPVDVRVSLKRRELVEEAVEPAPTREGSVIMDDCVKEISEEEEEVQFFEKDTEETNDFEKLLEMQKRVNLRIIRRSWTIWKIYIQHHKTRKKEKRVFKNKIEAFLSNLKDREAKQKVTGRENLKEKQAICEKKEKFLKKLMEEVKISQMETYQKLREISKGNLRIREKSHNPEFLNRLEERREERSKRRREIQEKKLKRLEEKKNAEKQKEEEKRRKEEENERRRLEEAREKRRIQMEKMKEQEREREKLRKNMKLAEEHHRYYLMHSYGFRPWVKLMEIRDAQQQQALTFYRRKLMLRVFNGLMSNAREEIRLKVTRAEEFYERILKKQFLLLWMNFHKENVERHQVAVDWHELKITEKVFQKWLQFTQDEQLECLNKKAVADLHYERTLKLKYLRKLRDYPHIKKLELARENRKRKWRLRVKEILPDYQPAESCLV